MRPLLLLFLYIGSALLTAPLYAGEPPTGPRTQDGLKVEEDSNVFMNVPEDMQIKKVGSNVLRPEDEVNYLARRLNELEKKSAQFEASVNKRIENLEKKADEVEKDPQKAEGKKQQAEN